MTDQLLDIFKYALLALIYLFFARVLWAVWSEVRGPRPVKPGRQARASVVVAGPTDPTVSADAPAPPPTPRAVRGKRGSVGRLVITQPRARKGSAFAVQAELTIGRATTCTVGVPDDTFASQLHARVFRRDGGVWVEDLGSTNGTHLNGQRIVSPTQLAKGDRLQIGNTVFEAE